MATPQPPEPLPRPGFRFDPTISIGNVLTIMSVVVAIALMANSFDKRTTILEQFVIVQQQINTQQKVETSDSKKLVREDYQRLSDKVDKILERLPRP